MSSRDYPNLPGFPDLPLHRAHEHIKEDLFDVFIAGSGPIGATYARLLVNEGYNVCMVELGDVHDTHHPAAHLKNEIRFQKDIDKFVRVIQGALSTVSIPTSSAVLPQLDPAAWRASKVGDAPSIIHGRNPRQLLHNNLGAEAVTRCVGGMSTHWTCATPEFLKGLERPVIFPDDLAEDDREWHKLYHAARVLIGTSEEEFKESIRHNTVLNALREDKRFAGRGVKPLPLACKRIGKSPYVRWHAAENVFGKDFFKEHPMETVYDGDKPGVFRLYANTRCTRLHIDPESRKVDAVEVRDLVEAMKGNISDFVIRAKVFVIAAGAVATPQILAKSGFGGMRKQVDGNSKVLIPNLGKRITEQPMAFCQIVLRQKLVEDVTSDRHEEWWRNAVKRHRERHPNDPNPIPVNDPEPQVNIPVSEKFPWHAQIHRDAFSYGEAGPLVDPRVVVDLRFFGMQVGDPKNRMIFENDVVDAYGMPQPTFEYQPTPEHAQQATDMMNDMTSAAHVLGGYLPGSNPQFMTPGLALHLGGSIRLGHAKEKAESVADYNSLVWDTANLYVAGNGTIPTPFAANPTLTSMALAIRSARVIRDYLEGVETEPPITPTPDEWLAWTDKNHPHYPDHEKLRELNSEVLS